MSDEDDLEDFEPDQGDSEKEEDEKETEEGEDYRKEGEEFPEEWLPTPLTEDMMKEGLSLLCKTGNGLAHAYVKLEVKERDLTDIYLLRSYIHLRYVDISENHLTDLSPLNYLTHLLWLKADGNRLRSAQLNELPYLQIASFAYNQITDTEGISHPRLETLNLKGNSIHMVTGLDPQKLISLHTVELRGNQLESTLGINLPKLKNLYLFIARAKDTDEEMLRAMYGGMGVVLHALPRCITLQKLSRVQLPRSSLDPVLLGFHGSFMMLVFLPPGNWGGCLWGGS
nr:leucine-rich repeat-containing protein 23 isoform X4 [Symphalangus syndactylus]